MACAAPPPMAPTCPPRPRLRTPSSHPLQEHSALTAPPPAYPAYPELPPLPQYPPPPLHIPPTLSFLLSPNIPPPTLLVPPTLSFRLRIKKPVSASRVPMPRICEMRKGSVNALMVPGHHRCPAAECFMVLNDWLQGPLEQRERQRSDGTSPLVTVRMQPLWCALSGVPPGS